jgi:hypothetical protein
VLASLRLQDLSLRHVIYRTDKQEQYIRAVVDGYESALAQIAEERDKSDLEECIGPLMQRFWAAIFETFFCFKHSAFEEEKEWRLVYPRFRIRNRAPRPGPEDVELSTQFRTKQGIVIPYVSIIWLDLSLVGLPVQSRLRLGRTFHGMSGHHCTVKTNAASFTMLEHRFVYSVA